MVYLSKSGYSIMSVNSRKDFKTEYYEPRQCTKLQVNKVPDTYYNQQISVLPVDKNPTTSASGSIDDNEFSSNKIIDQRRNYEELQVNNVPSIYDQQIPVSPAVQNLTPSTSDSIDNQFSSNRYIDQLNMYTLPTANLSETHYEPYNITTSSYNSLQSGCVIGKNEFYNYFFYFLFENYSCFYWLDNNLSTDQSLSETSIKIQKELVANNFILNRLLSKVENSSTTNQYIDSNFLSLFPMKTKEEFLTIEDKIVHEVDFVSKLESFIRSIGGSGTKNNITRVLQKIFIDEFDVIATLTGRGKNISVALGSSEIIKLVKRIIKANSNNVLTDSEYETVVANWLRHANTRYTNKRKDLSAVSSKYFKQLLKAEQQKFEKCSQRIVPTVSSFNVTDCVKNVIPGLQTSVDIITPVAECSNILDQPIASNYCIPYIETCSKFQVANDTPLSIENNATQNLSLSDKLRSLIVKYKISHNFCNSLLQILRSEGLEVPKNVRTLMETPKNHEIVPISGGSYVHLGIKNMLLPFLSRHNAQVYITPHILKIGINIDGLLIAKSSKSQLWPILISVINFKELRNSVIPIGIFHGFATCSDTL
ncbi:Uncharacterized protein FWK35_00028565, partial [Aphis craccivora]